MPPSNSSNAKKLAVFTEAVEAYGARLPSRFARKLAIRERRLAIWQKRWAASNRLIRINLQALLRSSALAAQRLAAVQQSAFAYRSLSACECRCSCRTTPPVHSSQYKVEFVSVNDLRDIQAGFVASPEVTPAASLFASFPPRPAVDKFDFPAKPSWPNS